MRRTRLVSLASLVVACSSSSSSTSDDDGKADRLSAEDRALCITHARECAFEPVAAGKTLSAEAADKKFKDCLAEAAVDDSACARACSSSGEPLCTAIIGLLVDISAESKACYEEFDRCVSTCEGAGSELTASKLEGTTESRCLVSGFHSNCGDYALGHDACGGHEYEADSKGECVAFCYATDGALDKDINCEEECGVTDEDDDLP